MPANKQYDVTARYVELSVSTNKSTALKTTTWNLGNFILEELSVLWAPGHVALTGIRILLQGTAILPWNQPSVFIVGDNERRDYEVGLTLIHPLTVQTQNNDKFVHTHILVAKLRDIPLVSDATPAINFSQTPVVV